MPKKTAEVQLARDPAAGERNYVRLVACGRWQCPIIPSLVRPTLIVKGEVPGHDVPQVVDPEADEVIQTLDLAGLNKSFRVCIQIRLSRPNADSTQNFA